MVLPRLDGRDQELLVMVFGCEGRGNNLPCFDIGHDESFSHQSVEFMEDVMMLLKPVDIFENNLLLMGDEGVQPRLGPVRFDTTMLFQHPSAVDSTQQLLEPKVHSCLLRDRASGHPL